MALFDHASQTLQGKGSSFEPFIDKARSAAEAFTDQTAKSALLQRASQDASLEAVVDEFKRLSKMEQSEVLKESTKVLGSIPTATRAALVQQVNRAATMDTAFSRKDQNKEGNAETATSDKDSDAVGRTRAGRGIDASYESSTGGDLSAVETLRRRLSGNSTVPEFGDDFWKARMRAYSPQGEQMPAFIIDCATEKDVQEAVIFANSLGLPVTARSGAHNLAEFSNVQGGVVVSQSTRKAITHDTEKGTITFEAGSQFQHVDAYLKQNAPGWFMQSAMISTIGITGSHNALGVGWLQRKVGNGIDNVVSIRVVLADGTVAVASKDENPDLFFGLRGAAPNFGIVTEMTEHIHNIGDPAQGKEVRVGCFFFGLEHGEKMWSVVKNMSNDPEFPDDAFILPLFILVDGKPGITLWYLQYLYSDGAIQQDAAAPWETQVRALVEETGAFALVPNGLAPSDGDGWEYIDHMEVQALFAPPWVVSFYPTGGFVSRDKEDAVFEKVLDHWRNEPQPEGAEQVPFHTTAFYHFGGKPQRERKATAWPGNSETKWLTATWGGVLTDQDPAVRLKRRAQTKAWVDKLKVSTAEDLQFAYICAAGYNWRSHNYARWIHGPSYKQLTDVKAKYDGQNTFNINVNIAPARR